MEDEKLDPTTELKKDSQAILEALKELTKIVAEMNKGIDYLKRAGKF